METLIIFLIFIVFTVVRSLGGQGRQQPPPRRQHVPPGLPGQPQRRVPQPPQPVFDQDFEYQKPMVRLRPPERKPESPPVLQEPERKPATVSERQRRFRQRQDAAYTIQSDQIGQLDLQLSPESVLLGVVFSEVLGKPRARRRNMFPVRPAR